MQVEGLEGVTCKGTAETLELRSCKLRDLGAMALFSRSILKESLNKNQIFQERNLTRNLNLSDSFS